MDSLAHDSPDQPHNVIISTLELRKSFGATTVLSGLTLKVRAGEIFGLIGPSGSGKSTAMHLFCGHLKPSSGTTTVLGETPKSFTARTKRRIGYMPQNFILYPDLTVQQNMSFAAGLYGLSEWGSRDRIRETLELVELWEARKRVVRATSGGMQRRLALAAALIHEPDLLFADEPTANLDPILRSKLWKHFRTLSDRGRTLFITTQYIDEAEYCDRVGLMYGGKLIAIGRPEELRRQAYDGDIVNVVVERPSPAYLEAVSAVSGVSGAELPSEESLRVTVEDADHAIPALIDTLQRSGARVSSIAEHQPTFDDVFVRLIEKHGESPSSTEKPVLTGAEED